MKVTLVRPTTFQDIKCAHPLNIGYIYASLSTEDYLQVDFIDGEMIGLKYRKDMDSINRNQNHPMWKDISQKILETKPDVIAFSCYSLSMTATKYIIELIRESNFKGQIWAGGIHPSTCFTETLGKISGLDGIVIGEGDITFKEVCRTIHNKDNFSNVKGIAYRKDGNIVTNECRLLIEDMDELPIPSRTFSGKYTYPEHIILTSRGCPFNCDFCDSKNMWTRRVRFRPADHVAREIKSIADLGMKIIRIRDDTFVLRRRHVESVCKSIKDNKLDTLRYTVNSRINTMNDDMLVLLKKMNVDALSFGVETGSPAVQERIKKNLDISTVVPTVLKTNQAGIRTLTFFMIGHPGETKEELEDTFSLIRDLSKHCKRNRIFISIVCPYPGTGYWDYATEKHGDFIDFYNESYKYHHHTKPFINITNMADQVLNSQIARIMRFTKIGDISYKFYTVLDNPSLLFLKLKRQFFFE